MFRVGGVYIYPIKSCAGASVAGWPVGRYGFVHDREFLVVDEDGKFLTQRTHPKLALVLSFPTQEALTVRAPNLPEMSIPWFESPTDHDARRTRSVLIWRDRVEADDMGDEIAAWFSSHLDVNVRLVRMGSSYQRSVGTERIPAMHQAALTSPGVGFADAFPFLIISEASLADLNQRLPHSIPMNRFRPNIVVAGEVEPYGEDKWETVQIGSARFRHGGPSTRCVITTTDQLTLERAKEPLKTLATCRRTPDGEVIFGMNFFCESPGEMVEVGDEVRVLQEARSRSKEQEARS